LIEQGTAPHHNTATAGVPVPGRAGRLIGLVTGGSSGERDRSLLSGATVAGELRNQGLEFVELDAAGADFADRVREVGVAFLAIAGQWAEDGKLQGLLDSLGVPYTGSGVLASAMAMHKPTAKTVAAAAGVRVLPHHVVDGCGDPEAEARGCAEALGLPVILKPCSEGGSIGMRVFRGTTQLAEALAGAAHDGEWFAEPFTEGAAVTCGVLRRDAQLVALPPLETVPVAAEFYDYAAKRDPAGHRYHCPAHLPASTLDAITTAARTAHRALRCDGYSRSDFLVTPGGDLFWLEANTLPGLSAHGNLATMAAAAGISYGELVQAILASAGRDGSRP
jgi:D-alanine-D-alanine ligase